MKEVNNMKVELALKLINLGFIAPGVEVTATVMNREGHEITKDINLSSVRENKCIGKSVTKDNTVYQFDAEQIHKISNLYVQNFLQRHNLDENGNRMALGRKHVYS